MIMDNVALKIAEGVKRQVPNHKSSVAVLKHGAAISLNVLFIVGLTLSLSFITGYTKGAAISLVGFGLLRLLSGGVHLKAGEWCVVVTTVLLTAISIVDLSILYVQMLNLLSLILVSLFAPSNIEKQSRIPKEKYVQLRMICILIVMCNVLIQSPVLAVTFFVQALSLIHRKEVSSVDTN
ncbi:accessory gene regulator ArgB-like protein [Paenibacillus pini]|uniref:Accessory gene regulator B n=1 Tax=Paenibacillus pini JCM 16418 TaxID=1236976 RepID=W7YTP5_9BACL|nr:accessory gene regulator B family protein [Paenibacillus pini]GAF07986.1 hypothetical protein JCM16418_2020 [Paenibacillus pini JCM 16418]